MHLDAGGFADFYTDDGAARTETILAAYGLMGVGAVNVSARELGISPEQIERLGSESDIPFLSANIVDEGSGLPRFATSAQIAVGRHTIGIVGIADPVVRRWIAEDGRTTVISYPIAAARPIVSALAEEADLVVLLAHVPMWKIESIVAGLPEVDIFLGADGVTTTQRERRIGEGGAVVSFGGRQGQHLGVLEIRMSGTGAIDSLRHRMVNLSPDMPEDPEIQELVEETGDNR